MLMLSIASLIMYQGMHVSHKHSGPLFAREPEGTSEVELAGHSQESFVAALAAALGGRAHRRAGPGKALDSVSGSSSDDVGRV
jgi:hypothetical protein